MESIFGQSLQLYYSKQARRHFRERKKTLENIRSRKDALAYVDSVRQKCAGSFVLPEASEVRKPARITGKIPFARGTIEKIIYYANGSGPVSANFYLPLLGGKVHDLLKAAALLASSGQKIRLIARGNGCIPAMLAKKLDPGISSVELLEPPAGWTECVKQSMPQLPQSVMLFGSVGKTDWK